MSERPVDTLSRWWWPGQWLRIVYAVWLDPAWYWANVRPRLVRGRPGRWGVYIQGLLGLVLADAGLSAALGGLLAAAGIAVDWQRLLAGALAGLLSATLIGLPYRPEGIGGVIALGVPWGVILAVTSGVSLGAIELYAGALAWGLGMGLAIAVGDGVVSGKVSRLEGCSHLVLIPVFLLIATMVALHMQGRSPELGLAHAITTGLSVSLVATAGGAAGLHLGWRWVGPRVPDAETRKRLLGLDSRRPL